MMMIQYLVSFMENRLNSEVAAMMFNLVDDLSAASVCFLLLIKQYALEISSGRKRDGQENMCFTHCFLMCLNNISFTYEGGILRMDC